MFIDNEADKKKFTSSKKNVLICSVISDGIFFFSRVNWYCDEEKNTEVSNNHNL
jgi:hypothetical protein